MRAPEPKRGIEALAWEHRAEAGESRSLRRGERRLEVSELASGSTGRQYPVGGHKLASIFSPTSL